MKPTDSTFESPVQSVWNLAKYNFYLELIELKAWGILKMQLHIYQPHVYTMISASSLHSQSIVGALELM